MTPKLTPRDWLDAALWARLRDEEPPSPPFGRAELEERSGEADARAWLEALREQARQADRVRRALEHERAQVLFPDGSSLSLDQAERQLARKEESRSHPALRRLVDEESRKTLRFDDFITDNREGICDSAQVFLRATLSARDAAREMLATVAREPLDTPFQLARALDLPREDGAFSSEAALALARHARNTAPKPARALARIRSPRRFEGTVLEKWDGVHLCTSEAHFRLEKHARSVFGAAQSVLLAQKSSNGSMRRGAGGLALGLLGESARRAVLGAPRAAAETAERAIRAAGLLEARLAAALWVAHADPCGPSRDADHAAALLALGGDPGTALLWERTESLSAEQLAQFLGSASAFVMLRESHDEGFALQREAWRAAAELPHAEAEAAAKAWSELVLERA